MERAYISDEQLDYLEVRIKKAAAKRVRRGMKKLDKVMPDWPVHLSLNDLNLSDGNHCVLGQLGPRIVLLVTGDTNPNATYTLGAEALFGDNSDEQAERCGFTRGGIVGWHDLNHAWEVAIGERQRAIQGIHEDWVSREGV